MTKVPGLDTIAGIAGDPPKRISLDFKIMKKQQVIMPLWNDSYIAMIPYCFKCKQPLTWHRPPYEEAEKDILFSCPNCGREWIRGEGWSNVQGQS